MKFFKLLSYDIVNGIVYRYKKYLIVVLVFFVFCIDLFRTISSYYAHSDAVKPAITMADYVFYIFKGMKEYIPAGNEPFKFPAIWIIVQLLPAHITLDYPYNDLESFGQHVLIRTGGRTFWWLSKCVWNMLSVIIFYFTAYATIILFCIFAKIPISFEITSDTGFLSTIMEVEHPLTASPGEVIVALFLLPPLISLGLCLTQMTLSLFFRPLYSFGITASILLSSAYLVSPFLVGNYSMVMRNSIMMEGGVNTGGGIIAASIMVVLSIFIGSIYFNRYDILKRE